MVTFNAENKDNLNSSIEQNFPENSISVEAQKIAIANLTQKRESGGTRYDHALRILDRLNNAADEPLQEEFVAAALLHDMLDTKKGPDAERNRALLPLLNHENGRYIIGILRAGEQFEEHAEQWREKIAQAAREIKSNDQDSLLLQELVMDCCIDGEYPEDITQELISILFSKGHENINKTISDSLWNFRAPIVDLKDTMEIMEKLDVEALILKVFEVMDNLRYPNPKNKVAGWRDSQEMISFYAPLMEICGLDSVATEAYGIALEYLNTKGKYRETDDPEIQRLINQYDTAVSYIESNGLYNQLLATVNVDDLDQGEGTTVVKRKPNFGYKTLGSFLEKCRNKPQDKFIGMTPDFIGAKICFRDDDIFDHSYFFTDLYKIFAERFDHASEYDIIPGHTRGEHSVEITYGNNPEEIYEDEDLSVSIKIAPERKSGYNAAHLSFIINTPEGQPIGLEVQITGHMKDYRNTWGDASHIMYKSTRAFGKIGHLQRLMGSFPDGSEELQTIRDLYTKELTNILLSIQKTKKRADEFRDREEVELTDYSELLADEFITRMIT